MIIFLILLGIISIVLFLWQLSNLISVFCGSPYVVANKKVIRLSLKSAGLKRGEVFYDLGCGNGQVLIEATRFGAKATGYEISLYYYILAKLRTLRFKNIEIRFKNIKDADLSKADVVYCYLLPKILEELAPKFKRELKSGSRLVSIGFPIIHAGAAKIEKHNVNGHKIFVYYF